MFRNACLRFLRDGGYRLSSQALLVGYSENVLPFIRKFSSSPIEQITNSKGNGDFEGQDAGDVSHGNTDFCREVSHADSSISALRKEFEKLGPKKLKETKDNVSAPQASHEKELPSKAVQPNLVKVVLDTPASALGTILDKWIEDGNRLERNEVWRVLVQLNRPKRYLKALQFLEWIERGKLLHFEERHYVYHLRLIGWIYGIEAAQKYTERVPKPFRNEVLYETLLGTCVHLADVLKAEEVFREIINLSLPLTASACNKMILLYPRIAPTKVIDIFKLMEKKNIKPCISSYKILIYLKRRSSDTLGVEAVLDMMKNNGIEPDLDTKTTVVKFYISQGLIEKAEEAVRAMEVYINDKRHAIRSLLHLYAFLGRPDDVERIWKSCTEPKRADYLSAIKAWGKLGHIEQVEETFKALLKTSPKITSKCYNAIVNVCAENKLLSKDQKVLERMCYSGCPSGPLTWDALVKLYVNSGEVEKADSFLLKVAEENPDRKPLFRTHIKLLKAYAQKGDIHNAEKIFDKLRKKRCPGRTRAYDILLNAYVNAKVPALGFIDRMRIDNVRPSKTVVKQLKHLDNLQKGSENDKF